VTSSIDIRALLRGTTYNKIGLKDEITGFNSRKRNTSNFKVT